LTTDPDRSLGIVSLPFYLRRTHIHTQNSCNYKFITDNM
jgi:hypothetical protein